MKPNTSNKLNEQGFPKKLLWKGTLREAIKLGKITQEEVDEWDCDDDIERAREQGYAKALEGVEKIISKCRKCPNCGNPLKCCIDYEELIQSLAKLAKEKTK